jgi:protein-S-isoprenylcysteine O-methyltransferase Ste14
MNVLTSRAGSGPGWVVAYGNWLFKHRNKVFPLVLLALFAGFPPVLAGGNFQSDFWLNLLGLVLAAGGQGLRALVIGMAYIKRGGINKEIHADTLVTEGFFAHARNPLYVGNLLILAGLFVIHNSPWIYLAGGACFVTAYVAIVAAEEAFLTRKFGAAYGEYCARVPRWVPDFRGLRATVEGMAFNWRRVVLKDYASCYTWVMTALALLGYEALVHASMGPYGQRLAAILGITIPLTGLFLAARALKKSKLLLP